MQQAYRSLPTGLTYIAVRACQAFQSFQLNEVDDIRKVCDNELTSTTDSSRITPPTEVHTMTAEAPSPPSPMQSLRDRLIQEGSIIPKSSVEKLRDKLNKKVLPIIAAGSDIQDEMRKSYLNYAISVVTGRAIYLLSEYESESFGERLRHIWTLRFSLLINKLDKFINFSFPTLMANDQSTPFARCGFYSPLKENMKNVP